MSGIAILKLQRAGFTEQQVEALAEYHEAGAATKSDIAGLDRKLDATRADIEIKLDALRSDLDFKISELDRKIDATRSDLESKFSELDNKVDRTRSDLERAIEKVRHDLELKIAEGKAETIRWVVGVGFAQVAMILAVLRLFPNVHP
jgi:Skp family chaperone for outer membrane proteins